MCAVWDRCAFCVLASAKLVFVRISVQHASSHFFPAPIKMKTFSSVINNSCFIVQYMHILMLFYPMISFLPISRPTSCRLPRSFADFFPERLSIRQFVCLLFYYLRGAQLMSASTIFAQGYMGACKFSTISLQWSSTSRTQISLDRLLCSSLLCMYSVPAFIRVVRPREPFI